MKSLGSAPGLLDAGLRAHDDPGLKAMTDDEAGRPGFLLQYRAVAGRRGRDRRPQRRRRYRLVDLASRVLAHRAGAARQPLRGVEPRGVLPVRHPAHALFGGRGHRRRCARRLHRAPVPERRHRSRRDRHRRADPDRRRGAPAQRPHDRRPVCAAGRQDGRGLGRRQPRNRDGGVRLGRGGALDPRQGDRDECRRRRRHLEDRGLRRRPGGRSHGARRRRAADLPRCRRPGRADRGSRTPLRRRARHRARPRRAPAGGGRPRARGPHGRPAVRGDARRVTNGRRRGLAAPRRAGGPFAGRSGHVLRRRRRSTSTTARRKRSATSAPCWRRRSGRGSNAGARCSNGPTRASARP